MADTDTLIVSFGAQIKDINSKVLASLDKEYKVILLTDDQSAMLLDNFETATLVKVTVEAA